MNKNFINNSHGKIFYWISSNNKKNSIIFTHGLTADHTLFDNQIDFWQKDFNVIVWDMPLHGESRPYKNFSIESAADDIKQILDTEHITHTIIAGQSAGGYPSQVFISKYPDMTDAFISIDSSPIGRKYYKNSELFWTNHYSSIAKFFPYGYYCKAASKAATLTNESQQSFYNALIKLGKKSMLKCTYEYYNDFINYEEVDFKCPVLLILGEHDKTGYVKKYNEMWNKKKNYPILIIPNASHNSNYDNYEFFNRYVYEFIQKNFN